MKTLILNCNPDVDYVTFDKHISQLKNNLSNKQVEVELIQVRDLELSDCIGCYVCWLKTPGLCVYKDGMHDILSAFVNVDKVILASPVKINFVSPLCKRVRDRMLPLVHPYLKIEGDRMSHLARYDKLPEQIIVLDQTENIEHIQSVYTPKQEGGNEIYNIEDLEGITNAIFSD